MSEKSISSFDGKKVSVTWDSRLCIHVAECGRASGDLFVGGRKPWCSPDLVELTDVTEVVERCPSGAIVCRSADGSVNETADAENTVTVAVNGPLFVRGDLDIANAPDDMPGVQYRAALCRCGQSKNKPFCDNSHLEAKFEDYGAVGESGTPISDPGGKLEIKPAPDGPLLVSGKLTINSGSGRLAWQGSSAALCRCGASKNKPFCDGQHKEISFKAD